MKGRKGYLENGSAERKKKTKKKRNKYKPSEDNKKNERMKMF